MSSFIPRNLPEIEEVAGCTCACIYNIVFRLLSCLQTAGVTVSHFTSASYWNSNHLIGWSKFFFKLRARVLTTKCYRSNQCLVFPPVPDIKDLAMKSNATPLITLTPNLKQFLYLMYEEIGFKQRYVFHGKFCTLDLLAFYCNFWLVDNLKSQYKHL